MIRKPSFALPLAVIVLIAQPVTTFCLMQMDREKGSSAARDVLEYALFFPSTVFDFFVRAITHKSPVIVFGAFWGDIVFGLLLNAVAWAVTLPFSGLYLMQFLRGYFPQTSNQSVKPTAPLRCNSSVFATTPCRGLSLFR